MDRPESLIMEMGRRVADSSTSYTTRHRNAFNLTLAPWQQGKGLFEISKIFLKALFYVPCISVQSGF